MRLWAIPDIHGELYLLKNLVETLYKEHQLDLSKDKLIFLGDMIDRGPDSYGVLKYIRELQKSYTDNVIVLAGNHDWMLVNALTTNNPHDKLLWSQNGGDETLESFNRAFFNSVPEEYVGWIAFLPLKHEEPGFHFSHAPLPKESFRNITLRGQNYTPDEYMWSYHSDEVGLAKDHKNGIIGISGHIHQLQKGIMSPRFYDHHYYLDCGAGCSVKAPLVAVDVKTKTTVYSWPKGIKTNV